MSSPRFGVPEGGAAWAAAALAVAALVFLPVALRAERRRNVVIGASALAASALSALYVALYLRGGPRIVDATTYLLQARALAHGDLAWVPAEPSASVAGRFLLRDALGDGAHLAGLFPPGWPAVLALGVRAGAPLAVGPVLAGLLVLATAWLAAEMARAVRSSPAAGVENDGALALLPATAALLSAVCACLRYHTADTMSHGLSALLVAVALATALRARRGVEAVPGGAANALACGLALGGLTATRPVSGVAIALVVAAVTLFPAPAAGARRPSTASFLGLVALGALPGITLLMLHQRAATGAWLASSQGLYYALADGPPGCFRFGFGAGIGCEHEHGAFVAANLQGGYGAYEAAATTLRRLKAHLVDPLNGEALFPLVVLGGIALRRSRAALGVAPLLVALAPVALLAAYLPFYFDGNYPGGGARFLADGLPVEHVLAAWGALAVGSRVRLLAGRPERTAAVLTALALLGFAARASFDHALLRDREGGRPMFESSVLHAAGVARGLVFVDTDHGFALGHDPAARAPADLEVVRLRGDALDRMVWDARGRPPAFRYVLSTLAADRLAEVTLLPFEPPPSDRVEGESLWPAIGARGASAWPRWASGTCASAGRWLAITLSPAPSAGGVDDGVLELALPDVLADPGLDLVVRLARAEGVTAVAELVDGGRPVDRVATAAAGAAGAPFACEELPPLTTRERDGGPVAGRTGGPGHLRIRFTLSMGPGRSRDLRAPVLALDAIQLVERR